jgi:large subunit ribosomal protein L24
MKRVKLKIKKGATVEVVTGSDKGLKGAVLEVDPVKMKIKVQGVKMQTHYSKQDGLQKREGFIDYSNVKMLEAPKASEAKTTKKKASTRK